MTGIRTLEEDKEFMRGKARQVALDHMTQRLEQGEAREDQLHSAEVAVAFWTAYLYETKRLLHG